MALIIDTQPAGPWGVSAGIGGQPVNAAKPVDRWTGQSAYGGPLPFAFDPANPTRDLTPAGLLIGGIPVAEQRKYTSAERTYTPELPAKPGLFQQVGKWINREAFGEMRFGLPTTTLGKTVAGAKIEAQQGGSVAGVFGEEYDKESKRLYGFNIASAVGGILKLLPVLFVVLLVASVAGPTLARIAGAGWKGSRA